MRWCNARERWQSHQPQLGGETRGLEHVAREQGIFYMLNTKHEDQQVARQLSDFNPQASARLPEFVIPG